MNNSNNNKCSNGQCGFILLGLFVGIGLALCGFFISKTMYNSRVALNTAYVKGLAERRVKADHASWTIHFTLTGKERSEIPALSKKAEKVQRIVANLIKDHGFDQNEISFGLIDHSYHENRDYYSQQVIDYSRTVSTSMKLETDKVYNISKAQIALNKLNMNKLVLEGITVNEERPSFFFTRLNEIKPDMLREATKNARIAANEFAENAGAHVGSISSASQGSFQITDVGEEYGDQRKIEKDVRVVTNITFYLKD